MGRLESDAIDECCQELFGHDNWAYGEQDSEKTTVIFYKASEENVEEENN